MRCKNIIMIEKLIISSKITYLVQNMFQDIKGQNLFFGPGQDVPG